MGKGKSDDMPDFLKEMLSEALSKRQDDNDARSPVTASQVMESAKHYLASKGFKVGDLLKRPADKFGQLAHPEVGMPVIVLEANSDRTHDENKSMGRPYSNGVNDIRVACFVPSGGIRMFWVDSAYLVPFNNDTADIEAIVKAQQLQKALADFQKTYTFSPGDAIKWKAGFCNKKFPRQQDEAIYLAPISPAIIDTRNSESSHYREVNDCVIGVVDGDDDFVDYAMDSRMFEPVVK